MAHTSSDAEAGVSVGNLCYANFRKFLAGNCSFMKGSIARGDRVCSGGISWLVLVFTRAQLGFGNGFWEQDRDLFGRLSIPCLKAAPTP